MLALSKFKEPSRSVHHQDAAQAPNKCPGNLFEKQGKSNAMGCREKENCKAQVNLFLCILDNKEEEGEREVWMPNVQRMGNSQAKAMPPQLKITVVW